MEVGGFLFASDTGVMSGRNPTGQRHEWGRGTAEAAVMTVGAVVTTESGFRPFPPAVCAASQSEAHGMTLPQEAFALL